ncbi:G2/mitotic-specific cyclin-B [Tribolium castaneum]|uniref:G2/mitotic-specific cyclin-B-like Protein n=1 Tax=Tribolium castaneum TaxID=7070 RepID=D6WMD6_TRICA|nr:PREDICTED: G2/mitotic-specific cyclin-B [Tribolium castaneum]EFA04254.1 G2/mitotic-specific cyclin-B-like Protein [Tribolium castaneum]|eukprot:XP_008193969.1 PREDICTED: G2/mitotic-specific cyclin-B [Tribolium castaneum]
MAHRGIVTSVENRENAMVARPIKNHLPAGPSRRPVLADSLNRLANEKPLLINRAETAKPLIKLDVKTKTEAIPQAFKSKPTKPTSLQVTEDNSSKSTKTEALPHEVKSYSSKQLDSVIEEDVSNDNDPQMVSEYITDIYKYLKDCEHKYPIRENFLAGHKSTPRMRTILVNWLVQVQQNFGLCLETLHLCVSIIDRYLQANLTVDRNNLQLVGTASLFIACKYEEMYFPELSDFEFICDNSFTKNQILRMEMSILSSLKFELGKPLSIHFLRRYSKVAQVRIEHHNLSKYLLELALLDYNMCYITPSALAAAASCLAMGILTNVSCPSKVWTDRLCRCSGYKYNDIKQVVRKFANLLLLADTSKHKAVYQKYTGSKFNKISTHPKLKGALVKRLAKD